MCSYASSRTRIERVAENRRLSRFLRGRHASQQIADVTDEAQVEHPVRLVEHRHPHRLQVVYLLLEVVDEPARSPDQHVETVAKHAALRLVARPAEHDAEPQAGVHTDLLGVPVNLDRELAGGRDHDGAGLCVTGVRMARLAQQHVHDSDQERRGLSGACLRLSFDVATGEQRRQRLRLDGRAVLEAGVLDAAQNRRFEVQAREPDVGEQPLGHRACNEGPARSDAAGDALPVSLSGCVSMRIESIWMTMVMFIRRLGNNSLSSSRFCFAASFGRPPTAEQLPGSSLNCRIESAHNR